MKTIEEFKKQAKKRNITRWNIHDCSICNYPCGFIIRKDDVFYDQGCNCSMRPPRKSSWDEIAEHYNNNAGSPDIDERIKKYPLFKEVIDEMNDFWGFKN